ncbi:MAG: hypothetical protein AB7U20_18850 [Planctomycetaceae bacterium]
MSSLLPPEFLFRYTVSAKHRPGLPRRGKKLLNLPEEYRLPSLAGLAGRTDFGEIRIAWNERGVGIGVRVTGKSHPPVSDPESLGETDGLRIWIDTRCTQSVHRAGRFCHQFEFLPVGGGDDGMQPVSALWPVARANEDSPPYDSDLLPILSEINDEGYTLEAWLPADSLHGFDPAQQPRMGFSYALHDAELGLQCLSLGPEFPFPSDPSLWCTLELAAE